MPSFKYKCDVDHIIFPVESIIQFVVEKVISSLVLWPKKVFIENNASDDANYDSNRDSKIEGHKLIAPDMEIEVKKVDHHNGNNNNKNNNHNNNNNSIDHLSKDNNVSEGVEENNRTA